MVISVYSSGRESILLHQKDNTATALKDLAQGEEIVFDSGTEGGSIRLQQDIPYGHKFARALILKGATVIKYGEVIGVATVEIRPGEHVHVQNVEGRLARGGTS